MNLSLTVKPPTEISVSPDIVSSVKSASISNCDLLVETRNLCSIDKFNFSKFHLRIFNSILLCFLSSAEPVRLLLVGEHVWQLAGYGLLYFEIFCWGIIPCTLGILYYSRQATCR